MTFPSWLSRFIHYPTTAQSLHSRSGRRSRNSRQRLSGEALEERIVLAGVLDPSFGGGDGIVTEYMGEADINPYYSQAVSIDNGKIVVGGTGKNGADPADFALVRFMTDGSLDSTFGIGGKTFTTFGANQRDWGNDFTIAPDGKYIVAGSSLAPHGLRGGKPIKFNDDIAIARYNQNGSLDLTFGVGGKVLTDFGASSAAERAFAVLVQPDGRIIVGGDYAVPATQTTAVHKDWMLARYNTNGSLDTTFGSNGIVTTNLGPSSDVVYDLAFQTVGTETRIVAVGMTYNGSNYDFATARYNSNGSLDSSFGQNGIVRTSMTATSSEEAYAVAIQPTGEIIVSGTSTAVVNSTGDIALVRYTQSGVLDTSFGGAGKVVLSRDLTQRVADMAIQSDGKIVVTGTENSATGPKTLVARFNDNGSLDSANFSGGVVLTDVNPNDGPNGERGYAVAIQPDGAIVVAGAVRPETATSTQFTTWSVLRFTGDSPPAPGLLAAATPITTVQQTLTLKQAQPILLEALACWEDAGANASSLQGIDVRIADLGGTTLGLASGNTIWLDDNAAGWGWFVDSTPGSSSEFLQFGNQGEKHRMDLLTVVMHEMGHLLLQDHDDEGVMDETLMPGVRRTNTVSEHTQLVDSVFSQLNDRHTDSLFGALLDESLTSHHPWLKRRR